MQDSIIVEEDSYISFITFTIYNGGSKETTIVEIKGQSTITIGSDQNATVVLTGADKVAPFHVRLNYCLGSVWLHDLAAYDFQTHLYLLREVTSNI